MKPTAFLAAAFFFASHAGAQTSPQAPAPAPSAPPATAPTAAPKPPGGPLILRLDEIQGPRMNVGPTATEKPPEKDLPTLGGKPAQNWNRSSDQAFPRDSSKAVGYE
jgi:hypothetical protein